MQIRKFGPQGLVYPFLLFIFLVPFRTYSQAPGGVKGYTYWITNYEDPFDYTHTKATNPNRVGTYKSGIDTLVLSQFEGKAYRDRNTTLFVVLKPVFPQNSTDTTELSIAGANVGREHIITHGDTSNHIFQRFKPQVITVRKAKRTVNGAPLKFASKDSLSHLFDITELIYYDRILDPYSTRKVGSYLAFKYGINIVKDNDTLWNDYYNADSLAYWQYEADSAYGDVILGLGRHDSTSFLQTQALIADSNDIVFGIDTITLPGFMPQDSLDHRDFLLICRDTKEDSTCAMKVGAEVINGTWKLRKFEWDIPNQKLIVGVKKATDWTSGDTAKLWITDGAQERLLNHFRDWNKYRFFRIPMDSLVIGTDYLFEIIKPSNRCMPQARYMPSGDPNCENPVSGMLSVQVPGSTLPATLSITHLASGQNKRINLSATYTTIESLLPGQYEITLRWGAGESETVMRHVGGVNAQKGEDGLISINDASGGCIIDPVTLEFAEVGNEESASLSVYPNPAQKGVTATIDLFTPTPCNGTIQITDASGRPVRSTNVSPDRMSYSWEYTSLVPGVYYIHYHSDMDHITRELIVQ